MFLRNAGRWAFAELTDVFRIEEEFGRIVDGAANDSTREDTP